MKKNDPLRPLDLFGANIEENELLRERFIEPPFSVLDTRAGTWQNRKRKWLQVGIQSEVSREHIETFGKAMAAFDHYRVKEGKKVSSKVASVSVFDPALCEVLYSWFCPEGGTILDPFAGGSVRGIVANYLGFKYTGIDIRQEQIDSNREQALTILDVNNQPQWYVGDSYAVLDERFPDGFDMLMSCPPYADLEKYSDLPGDISNMPYIDFEIMYTQIIKRAAEKVKPGGFAAWVVGEVRDKKSGNYYGFVPDTIRAFKDAGMPYYNEIVLINMVGSAPIRAGRTFDSGKKICKMHQNVLVFKKPE